MTSQAADCARVVSTNVARPRPSGVRRYDTTGIDKRAVSHIDVAAPGPNYEDGSGVAGDFIGDAQHHGGNDKAVYAFAREELDYWQQRLGAPLADGAFGENLTTSGIDLSQLRINQRLRVGEAVLEVSIPRQPCATFAAWMQQKGWVKTFTERGDCGSYLRVITPGRISAGDELVLADAPSHPITMSMAFRAKMGDKALARQVVAAGCLPPAHQEKMARGL